jgi:hypothetical protein
MEQSGEVRFTKRRIILKDGRYLIFYTFEDPSAPPSEDAEAKGQKFEPEPHTKAQRSV